MANNNKNIGLIAGNRRLPFQFADWARRGGRELYVAGIRGEVDGRLKDEIPAGRYREFYITDVSKIIDFFRINGVGEAVMIGGIARAKLWPTFDLFKVLARLAFVKNRHKGVFAILMSMFDRRGVKIRAIQELMPELVIGAGALGKVQPSADDIAAFKKNLGAILDYTRTGSGQSAVIWNGSVLAYEGFSGTDSLIRRAAAKRREQGGSGGIMVKIMEPGQDARADLPVVGTGTLEVLARHGIRGVIVEAGRAIADDMAETVKLADESGIFVYGAALPSEDFF